MIRSLCVVALAVVSSCGGGVTESPLRRDLDALYGQWTWVYSCCGISGSPETPETTGQSRLLVIERPGTIRFYRDSDLIASSDFTVRFERRSGRDVAWLVLEGSSTEPETELRLRDDTLELIRTCADCPSERYERIRAP
jgi:hypothetical protein